MGKVLSTSYEGPGYKARPSKFQPKGRVVKAPENRYKVGVGMEPVQRHPMLSRSTKD